MPRLLLCLLLPLIACSEGDTDADTDTDTDTALTDADQDGSPQGEDCDDHDPARFPGSIEHCDGVDNDCDGLAPFEGDGGAECAPCEAAGYWADAAAFSSPADLRDRLELTSDTVSCDYTNSTFFLFTELDNVDGLVEGVYTGVQVAVGDEKPDHTIMNTEHSWPQSQGAGEGLPRCDLNHLFPTDSKANSRRANYPFGIVAGQPDWQQGGSMLGDDADGQQVFEPRDVHKGNAARAIFYFAMRYDYDLDEGYETVLRAMNGSDPVDDDERDRGMRILGFQGNTNPFVACDFLVDEMDW